MLAPFHTAVLPPTLTVGLIGFSRPQERLVESALASNERAAPAQWRLESFPDADAWFVNGARAQVLEDGSLRIPPGVAGERSVRLTLDAVDRPLAFAGPLGCAELEVAFVFEPANTGSIHDVLDTMASRWLCAAACHLWIAQVLVTQPGYRSRIYHLVSGGRLLATIDRLGDVGVLPGVTLAELQQAEWSSRPVSAGLMPPKFVRASFSEVLWKFANRAEVPLVPDRYFTQPIYFRRPPRIAQRLLADDHLAVLKAVAAAPAGFADIQRATGLDAGRVSRTLSALYLTGAITTSLARAVAGRLSRSPGGADTASVSSAWSSSFCPGTDFTVPARLHAPAG